MSVQVHPVRVDASLEPHLSRGLWLVKWIMVLPHYVVLAFLWLAFLVLSVVAFFAILFTGRYPRQIFEFNLGVLRWSWRVAYYAYGALGTDRYPPFTMGEVPDYPAHLDISYPEHLSRGLVLVKWWLLALPHYLVVAFFLGGGYAMARSDTAPDGPWFWTGGGLIGLLVLVAGVILLFTGTYPRGLFDLILGLNRWVLRVAGYSALMTDAYPPFRLDLGGSEPGSDPVLTLPSAGDTVARPSTPTPSRPPWTTGRVVGMVLGCLLVLTGGGLLAGGTALAVTQQVARDDAGYVMSGQEEFTTATRAVTTKNIETRISDGAQFIPDQLLGQMKLSVAPQGSHAIFVGIGPTAQVRDYLGEVAHTTVVDFKGNGPFKGAPVYEDSTGGAPAASPAASSVDWAASSSGTGRQDVVWSAQDGNWTLVVMNADGSSGVAFKAAAGAEFPALGWIMVILFSMGGVLLIAGIVWIIGMLNVRRPTPVGPGS